jgi:hypothetical protein
MFGVYSQIHECLIHYGMNIESKLTPKSTPNDNVTVVVGRGKYDMLGNNIRFQLSKNFINKKILFASDDANLCADITGPIHMADYNKYKITKENEHTLDLIFVYDCPVVYCEVIENIKRLAKNLNRKFAVYTPLGPTDKIIPNEIKKELANDIFNLQLVKGEYPLFNWCQSTMTPSFVSFLSNTKYDISSIVNRDHYLVVNVFN